MTPTYKPIETRYKGYRFRSRLEARWAVFFDALFVKWEYEKEGYNLGKSGLYLPDFWLPELNLWVEIKANEPTDRELSRCKKLAAATDSAALIVTGLPGDNWGTLFCCDLKDSSGGESEWEADILQDTVSRKIMLAVVNGGADREFFTTSSWTPLPVIVLRTPGEERVTLQLQYARDMARAARFEHGEHGA